MNNELFGANELSTIDNERLIEIKNYALYEYNKYMDKIINSALNTIKITKPTSDYKNSPKIARIPTKPISLADKTLENHMEYRTNTKNFPLNNGVEKIFFKCNGVFPNDEKFLNTLLEHDFLNILDEFIKTYSYIEKKYKDNETLAKMQKYMQYKKLAKNNGNELIKLREYFSKFHCINDISLIINKLLQIYYFNPELYNSYIEINENKKTSQKVNKIG